MPDLRPILYVNGILLSILALVMLIPAAVDLAVDNSDWEIFLMSSVATGFIGVSLLLSNMGYNKTLNLRQAFLFTTISYFMISVFAAIPLYLADIDLHSVDAFFEAVSGITATGATVINNIDSMPPGILLWRSLLNGLGGIGIVVLTMALLPMLQIGGMQLFRTESSDRMEKILPRTTQIAGVIAAIFTGLTFLCAICYWLAGMNGFDAICHALTTVATGGFSTHNESLAHFKSPTIEYIAMVFMITGALPLMLYYRVLKGEPKALWYDTQVRFFLGLVLLIICVMTLWLMNSHDMGVSDAFRLSAFNIISVITTTGYSSADYSSWGTFAVAVFFMLLVVGGCSGSTSGGIKIFRFQVLHEIAKAQIHRLLQPNGVFVPRFNGKAVNETAAASVMTFFLLFALLFMTFSVILSFFGLDFLSAMSVTAQALANVGVALGDTYGPSGNYNSLPDATKWLISLAMIMGRLELFTIIVLFSPRFWRG